MAGSGRAQDAPNGSARCGGPSAGSSADDPGFGRDAARDVDDDFFCLRYRVWYPSFDCAVRTRFKTAPGCANCEQGRFNHRRHANELARYRYRLPLHDVS
jgi:hypothetical protein